MLMYKDFYLKNVKQVKNTLHNILTLFAIQGYIV
jgi:hypothetical protein